MPEDVTTPTAASKSTKVQAVLEPRFYDFDYETTPVPLPKAKAERETKSAPVVNGLAANQPQWTLLLGTFVDHCSAIDLARRVKSEPGLVNTNIVQGKVRYLVSTRPQSRDQDVGRNLNATVLNLKKCEIDARVSCPDAERQFHSA